MKGKFMANSTTGKYIKLLIDALQEFYVQDVKDLFKNKMADERAMVGCIYRYIWCLMHNPYYDDLEPDIDIEYDRMSSPHSKKAFDISIDHKDSCIHNNYENCGKLICNQRHINGKICKQGNINAHKKKKWRDFRPDLIIHKRGSSVGAGNGMVVEFKKENAESSDIDFDKAKVMYCTCPKADFRYLVGAVVLLCNDKCEVHVFKDGQFDFSCTVDAAGRIPKDKMRSKTMDARNLRYGRRSGNE